MLKVQTTDGRVAGFLRRPGNGRIEAIDLSTGRTIEIEESRIEAMTDHWPAAVAAERHPLSTAVATERRARE